MFYYIINNRHADESTKKKAILNLTELGYSFNGYVEDHHNLLTLYCSLPLKLDKEFIEFLFSLGQDPNHVHASDGFTALHYLAQNKYASLSLFRYVHSRGANLNLRERHWMKAMITT